MRVDPHPTSAPGARSQRAASPFRWLVLSLIALALFILPTYALASETNGEAPAHLDPFANLLLLLCVVVLAAALGRWTAIRFNQPPVLGELVMGAIVGNVGYAMRIPFFEMVMNLSALQHIHETVWNTGLPVREVIDRVMAGEGPVPSEMMRHVLLETPSAVDLVNLGFALWIFSSLGVVLLLFKVGLETHLSEMLRVGGRAMGVAVVGTVLPFALGYASSLLLAPNASVTVHIFLGATLCATSVGITARVFSDLHQLKSREARVVLGAAVIDDVLGLLVLAVVAGIATTGHVSLPEVARISVLSFVFLGAVMLLGERFARVGVRMFSLLDPYHLKLLYPLSLMFLFAWFSARIGLAPIVGAFAAGLILNETLFHRHGKGGGTLEDIIYPLEGLFAPIFFVLMGMQVNLATFTDPNVMALAGVLLVAATAGKLLSGLAAGPGVSRLTVGLGMLPRGEVGLIFASIGKSIGAVDDSLYSALVIVIILTTVVTAPALKFALARKPPRPDAPA